MPATKSKKASGARRSTATRNGGAIELLTSDHRSVKKLFKQFEKLQESGSAQDKAALVQRICLELIVHARIEEEIFYPATRAAIKDDDLMDEADVEHATAKQLIAELQKGKPGDDHWDAKVTVLGEYIDHHAKEEEKEMFPKARRRVDDAALGGVLLARKAELLEVAMQAGDAARRAPTRKTARKAGPQAKAG